MRKFKLGLCGWGTVARALHQLCEQRSAELARRYGVELEIVAMSSRRLPGDLDIKQCPSVLDIPDLDELDAVVELIGGTDTAGEIAHRTLSSGKHLLTANKALLVRDGQALGELARQQGVRIGPEASLAGAIPIMRVLRSSFAFAAGEVQSIRGILNGTCNFILSAMERGQDFNAALKQAQEMGFAEADPTLDIDGTDAASKLALMLNLIYAAPLGEDRVAAMEREGIVGLEPFDFQMASQWGHRIRHLAVALPESGGMSGHIEARVHLAMIPEETALACVQDETNAIHLGCAAAGDSFLQGLGAGGEATASAVLSDALDIALNPGIAEQLGQASADLTVGTSDNYCCARYLRLDLENRPGTLSQLTTLTGELKINIDSISQHAINGDKGDQLRRVVLRLSPCTENQANALLSVMSKLPDVRGEPFQLRVGTGWV